MMLYQLTAFKAEYEVQGYLIDDLSWSKPIYLMLKDVLQPLCFVRECLFHAVAVEQSLHNLGYIETRLHIQVSKGLARIIETTGILLLQHIDHLLHNTLGREDLIGLLRRDIVENILGGVLNSKTLIFSGQANLQQIMAELKVKYQRVE